MNPLLRLITRWALRLLRTVDLPLLCALLVLMACGLVALYSAGNGSTRMVLGQGSRFAVGLGLMWAISRVPPAQLRAASPWVFMATLLPVLATLLVGSGRHGNLWLNLGVFYFQPSELVKLTLPMALAWYLHQRPLPPGLRTTFTAFAMIAPPLALIHKQPDDGTAMLIGATAMLLLFLAGLTWWWFAAGAGAVAVVAPVAWFWLLRPYQKDRILTYVHGLTGEQGDTLGAGWNITQSKIAIGSGGWSGKGWMQGTQSHLDYLPEHTTDFLFSVLGEEFGWLGVMVVFTAYLAAIARCLWLAGEARDTWSRLVAATIGLSLFLHVLVNGGMIAGLLPVVGVPMPLLSYGGTSSIAVLMGMGLVMSAGAHARRRA